MGGVNEMLMKGFEGVWYKKGEGICSGIDTGGSFL